MLVEKETPTLLTEAPDDTVLEDVIGDLQSSWGVPQYPQEYRITIKVAEKGSSGNGGSAGSPAPAERSEERSDGPKREKAPSPARMAARSNGDAPRESAPRRRSRRRGRGRRKGSGGGSGAGGNASQ